MHLRDNPFIRFHGVPTWPPIWSSTAEANRGNVIKGEVGVLKQCSTHEVVKNICFLFIECEGKSYVGALVVDDASLCQQLSYILKQNIGRPIAEIGALDLSHTL